jgi:hypothetical protein
MFGFSPKFLAERPSLEQIICNGVERGVDPDMPGDDEQKAKGPYNSEQQLAGGRACAHMLRCYGVLISSNPSLGLAMPVNIYSA